MTLFAATDTQLAAGQIALAALLAAAGFYLLLPRPRGRQVAAGVGLGLAGLAVFGAWLYKAFGQPMPDMIGTVLFALFSAGALGFGTVLVVQRNPARGAIAFAFVILSTCGLFLLLAAPFLMAATIIIYAGAIIVTFLFVLMLSHAEGPSDENDRSREPLLGAFSGFAFAGLVLFTLYETRDSVTPSTSSRIEDAKRLSPLPAPAIDDYERETLTRVSARLREADDLLHGDLAGRKRELDEFLTRTEEMLELVVGLSPDKPEGIQREGSIALRLAGRRSDPQARAVLDRAAAVRDEGNRTFRRLENTLARNPPDVAAAKADLRRLREEVDLLRGAGEIPARNVGTLGLVLYADHLLAVELAGTLLLVATIGAVAIAHRKGVVS